MAIQSYKFDPTVFKILQQENLMRDWPVVYILEDGKEMYVGQTGSTTSRFKQHYSLPQRQKLSRAHVLVDEESNMSATHDIEAWLIQYFVADSQFELQNGNGGLSNHSYYDREKYKAKFEVIWKELQDMGLARRDLVQLRNTDLFKYSPYKALTKEQIGVVDQIKTHLMLGEHRTHLVSGEPGTGKSVLATYLIKFLTQSDDTQDLKIALVIPQSGLRKTLQRVFSKITGLKSSMVVGPTEVVGKDYDLLIVDEAHRLRRRINLSAYGPFDKANAYYKLGKEGTQLDWVMRASRSQVFLYDGNQSVVPGDIRADNITSIKAVQHRLTSQLRVMAGNDYIKFVDDMLSLSTVSRPEFGEYDLRYFSSAADMFEEIRLKDKEHRLARMVAGNAWTWETKKGGAYDIELGGIKMSWNSTNIDWVNSPNAVNEVGCIHTVQGYDLNYVGVIMGPELSYDPVTHTLNVDKKKYMDINGRRSIESPEELKSYIINIYKTLLTRGIKGTYIHAVDKNLANYLQECLTL